MILQLVINPSGTVVSNDLKGFTRTGAGLEQVYVPLVMFANLIGIQGDYSSTREEVVLKGEHVLIHKIKSSQIKLVCSECKGSDDYFFENDDLYVSLKLLQALLPVNVKFNSLAMKIEFEPLAKIRYLDKYKTIDEKIAENDFLYERDAELTGGKSSFGASVDQNIFWRKRSSGPEVQTEIVFPLQKFDTRIEFGDEVLKYKSLTRRSIDQFRFLFLKANEVSLFDTTIPFNRDLRTGGRGRGFYVNNFRSTNPKYYVSDEEISGKIDPGWTIEIYQNDIFLGKTTSDEKGIYLFPNIKMIFGQNNFRLNFYGPGGEFESEELNYNVSERNSEKGIISYEFFAGESLQSDRSEIFAKFHTNISRSLIFNLGGVSTYNVFSKKKMDIYFAGMSGFLKNNTFTFSNYWSGRNEHLQSFNLENGNSVLPFSLGGSWRSKEFLRADSDGINADKVKGGYVSTIFNNFLFRHLHHKASMESEFFVEEQKHNLVFLSNLILGNISFNNTYKYQLPARDYTVNQNARWFNETPVLQADVNYHSKEGFQDVGGSLLRNYRNLMDINCGFIKNLKNNSLDNLFLGMNFYSRFFTTRWTSQFFRGRSDFTVGANYNLSLKENRFELGAKSIAESAVAKVSVYIDKNRNEVFDAEEELVPGVELLLSGFSKNVKADDQGNAYVTGLPAYTLLKVVINMDSIQDITLKASSETFSLYLRPGALNKYFLPLQKIYSIEGRIPIAMKDKKLKVVLRSLRDNSEAFSTATFENGFYFDHVIEGRYKLLLNTVEGETLRTRDIEVIDSSITMDF